MRKSPMPPRRETPRRVGPRAPRIKAKREEDPEHLKRVRSLPCWACEIDRTPQPCATETHHPRPGQGIGTKAGDDKAIPLCGLGHHRGELPGFISIHKNPIEFRARYGAEEDLLARTIQRLAMRKFYEELDDEIAERVYGGVA